MWAVKRKWYTSWFFSGRTCEVSHWVRWCFLLHQSSMLLIAIYLLANRKIFWDVYQLCSLKTLVRAGPWGTSVSSSRVVGPAHQLGLTTFSDFWNVLVGCSGVPKAMDWQLLWCLLFWGSGRIKTIKVAHQQQSRKLCLCRRCGEMQLGSWSKRHLKWLDKSSGDGTENWSWDKSFQSSMSPALASQKRPGLSPWSCWEWSCDLWKCSPNYPHIPWKSFLVVPWLK